MKLICDFNFDQDLNQINGGENVVIKAQEFVEPGVGWYWKAIDKVYPLFDEILQNFPHFEEKFP